MNLVRVTSGGVRCGPLRLVFALALLASYPCFAQEISPLIGAENGEMLFIDIEVTSNGNKVAAINTNVGESNPLITSNGNMNFKLKNFKGRLKLNAVGRSTIAELKGGRTKGFRDNIEGRLVSLSIGDDIFEIDRNPDNDSDKEQYFGTGGTKGIIQYFQAASPNVSPNDFDGQLTQNAKFFLISSPLLKPFPKIPDLFFQNLKESFKTSVALKIRLQVTTNGNISSDSESSAQDSSNEGEAATIGRNDPANLKTFYEKSLVMEYTYKVQRKRDENFKARLTLKLIPPQRLQRFK